MTPETKQYRLPKEFAEKWIDALRSGEYKQGEAELYTPKTGTFCCLGVCARIGGNKPSDISGFPYLTYARLLNIPKELFGNSTNKLVSKLTHMNDGAMGERKHTFPEIASWLEENVEFYETNS